MPPNEWKDFLCFYATYFNDLHKNAGYRYSVPVIQIKYWIKKPDDSYHHTISNSETISFAIYSCYYLFQFEINRYQKKEKVQFKKAQIKNFWDKRTKMVLQSSDLRWQFLWHIHLRQFSPCCCCRCCSLVSILLLRLHTLRHIRLRHLPISHPTKS